MKRLTKTLLILLLTLGLPFSVMAMSHGEHGDMKQDSHDMDHSKEMSHDMHKGHAMGGDDFVEVGKAAQSGVVVTVKVKTYDEKARKTMANMGMNATHHVMVFFTDEKSGKEIDDGKVALKVKNAAGETAKPVMLMHMDDGFGGDVTIEDNGMVTFEIGTMLKDGNKRQFEVGFHNM